MGLSRRLVHGMTLAACVVTAGCSIVRSDEGAAEWSTKDDSVLPRPEEPMQLTLPEPFEMYQGPQLREAAGALLLEGAASDSALLRANAIEAMHGEPALAAQVVGAGLTDENRGVRYVSAMMVGKLELAPLVPLVEPLLADDAASVRAAAIFALRRCGRPVDPTPLSRMLLSDDPEVKGNAAFVLGGLGDPSAIPMLRAALQRRSPRVPVARARIVELQIAEAMVRLGADGALDVVRAAIFTPAEQGELTVLACQILGRVGDRAYMSALLDKVMRTGEDQEPIEVRLAAAQALAQIDRASVLAKVGDGPSPIEVVESFVTNERAEVRAQAAVTIGWARDPAALPLLGALLDDPNPVVQIVAAGAILRIR